MVSDESPGPLSQLLCIPDNKLLQERGEAQGSGTGVVVAEKGAGTWTRWEMLPGAWKSAHY